MTSHLDIWQNIGQDRNDPHHRPPPQIGLVHQYIEANNLFINPTKTHYILFQMQCRQESELKNPNKV
jgi:hypothetical protein